MEEISVAGFRFLAVRKWLEIGIHHGFGDRSFDGTMPTGLLGNSWSEIFAPTAATIALLQQVHGVKIVEISDFFGAESRPNSSNFALEGDGWLGNLKSHKATNVSYAIKTADCFPLIILARAQNLFAVLHCGWRGSTDGILVDCLQRLIERGCEIENIEIAIGPGAQQCCYEIGDDLVETLELSKEKYIPDSRDVVFFRDGLNGKKFGNISKLLLEQAKACGIPNSNIYATEHCTICNQRYFSYRRGKSKLGRQVSFVTSH